MGMRLCNGGFWGKVVGVGYVGSDRSYGREASSARFNTYLPRLFLNRE